MAYCVIRVVHYQCKWAIKIIHEITADPTAKQTVLWSWWATEWLLSGPSVICALRMSLHDSAWTTSGSVNMIWLI